MMLSAKEQALIETQKLHCTLADYIHAILAIVISYELYGTSISLSKLLQVMAEACFKPDLLHQVKPVHIV